MRGSEERSDELPTLVLGTRATGAPTFIQVAPPPLSQQSFASLMPTLFAIRFAHRRDLAAQCNDLVDIEGSRTPYNACLQNWYEPSHTIGLHADDEKQMDNRLPIFSLSWGGTRRFLLRPKFKPTGEGVSEFFLTSGSLFVMGGTTQSTHKHEIPKWRKTKDPPTSRRVNYTMRAFERQEEGPVSKRRKI